MSGIKRLEVNPKFDWHPVKALEKGCAVCTYLFELVTLRTMTLMLKEKVNLIQNRFFAFLF